jgi:penicillin-binding protein 1A
VRPVELQFNRPADPADAAPHFVAQVRKQALEWADQNDRDLYTEGLVIHTTLDSRLQDAAANAVDTQARALQAVADVEWSQDRIRGGGSLESYAKLAPKADAFAHFWAKNPELLREFATATPEYRKAVAGGAAPADALRALYADKAWLAKLKQQHSRLEAGFIAIDPASGGVRAWVGSRDFEVDQFDHVVQAARQPRLDLQAVCLRRGPGKRHALDAQLHGHGGRHSIVGRQVLAADRHVRRQSAVR